jgi:class 3 adenylate cyclase/tetratricopeptide (TPR) repeat protein
LQEYFTTLQRAEFIVEHLREAMTSSLSSYLPQDRRVALARGVSLPDRTMGTALFADVSGFTPLTEGLTQALGPRRGAEVLTHQLDKVYHALIAEVERYAGSVVGFAGDAIMCWFDISSDHSGLAPKRATACALALQKAMAHFAAFPLPNSRGATTALALKTTVASGPARRFAVGDPNIQLIDALAGATVARTALAEHLTHPGEVLVDAATAEMLGDALQFTEWRVDVETGERFAVVAGLQSVDFRSQIEIDQAENRSAINNLKAEMVRPWLLPAVFEREQSGQGAFLTEFRPAVALFLRFVGLDYESDAAGPQLDAFIRRAHGVLARYEGVLLQLTIGDKGSYLYANFGAPIAHEDDARRAVRAAVELRAAAGDLSFLAPVQIGLSRGTMRAGAYGGATRRTYGVLGDDVNLAARLMAQAAPGEVLLSATVQQAIAEAFSFEPRPPLAMKGKAQSLPVFAVTGTRQHRAIRLQEPAYALPMVGRQTELRIISEKIDLALQGKGQVVGIVAEAGMGKSRLVAEAIRAARRKGFVGYGGACQSDGVNTPYLAWKDIWSAFFDVEPTMPQRKLLRNLEGEIEDRAPGRVEALPLLGAVLDLSIPDNDFTTTLEPKTRQSALHALLEDCLKAAAREEPLLLVVEDMHWIDALSHDLLEQLARATAALPVLIVLAYRPPQLARLAAPRIEALPHFTRLGLGELSAAECDQAIRAKLAQLYPARGGGVPPLLVTKLTARAQGNPFYLEELLNYLRDRGLDPHDPAALDQIELPDSLHALILSRVDQLTEREKTTLHVASIIGRSFRAAWLPGYYPALGELAQVKADLDELDKLEVTPLDTAEPELVYLFKHIVTHEVAYESLPYATRAQLHEQLAHFLETQIAAGALGHSPLLDTLAYHYGQSTNTAKQREYFQKAGEAAQAAFANEAALEYYARLGPLLTEPIRRVDLHLQSGVVLERLGRWEEAKTHYHDALAQAAGDAARRARCQFAMGKLCRLHGDYPAALEWLAESRAAWEALNQPAGLGQTLIEMGYVFRRRGENTAAWQHLQAGLIQARAAGDRPGEALALNNLGLVAWNQGDYAAARSLYQESLALRRQLGDRWGISASLTNLGLVAETQGDHTAAWGLLEESLALDREMGDKPGIAISLINLGNVAWNQGDYAAAQVLYEESLALSREMGDKRGIVETLVGLAGVATASGDMPRATRLASAAESLRVSIYLALGPLEQRIYERAISTTRAALGEDAFNAAWAEGQAITLEDAIALALTWESSPAD